MTKFEYTTIGNNGKALKGTVEAATKDMASTMLIKQGIKPLALQPQTGSKNLSLNFMKKKVKLRDLVVFTRQLSTMINAGVPLSRSLNTLQAQTENQYFKEQLTLISKEVEGGISFADALAKHPTIFSPIYVNMVRAGETGGILDDILKKLASQQEKDAAIRAKIKSASTYPIILMVIMIGAFFGLTLLVIPQIGSMLKEMTGDDALPIQTTIMLGISDFMKSKWYILLGGLIGGTFFFRRWHKTTAGKKTVDYALLKMPVLKTVIAKVAIARFARIYASLMSAGVSVLEALDVTGKAIGNSVYQSELSKAAQAVRNGKQLSEPISQSVYFPPIVSQMMAIGEETGESESILLKVADFYEEEVDALVDGMSSIIEPVMICLLGGMVGLIAASVIGPISSLTQNIEGAFLHNTLLTLLRLWL